MGKELYKALVALIWWEIVPIRRPLQNCEPPLLKIFSKELYFFKRLYSYILWKLVPCINLV